MAVIVPFIPADLSRLGRMVTGALKAGDVVAVPTETYYGLAVNPFAATAVDRLFAAKGRADGKPLLVLIGEPSQLSLLVSAVSPAARVLMEAFWPGPLTVVFDAHPSLPESLTAGTGTVGVRWTGCVPLQQLLTRVGPVTGTSANPAGAPPADTADGVQRTLGDRVAVIVDAGRTPGGLPSTVIDARDSVRMIRDGAVSRHQIENVLQTRGISVG
jgi:L-threonylcarbamoyladenylate synthase